MRTKPIKIVHITTIPESLYVFFEGQLHFMQQSGFEVVAISSPGEWLDAVAARENIQTFGLEMTRQITPLKDLLAFYRLCRLLLQLRPDIVHAHTPKAGLLGTCAAWLLRVPVRIYHIHGLPYMTATGLRGNLLKLTEFVSCTLATRVLCVSNSILQHVVESRICARRKIKTLLSGSINGVNTETKFNPERFSTEEKDLIRKNYQIQPGNLVLGFVGRIVKDKGIYELCKAWELIREEFANVELLLVGHLETIEAPLSLEVMKILHEDPRIHLIGIVKDPVPAYAIIDLLILPTYREGFGLAAIEASAMRIPVVATNIPGCVDAVIQGKTGTLVQPYDVQALYLAMRNYIRDPQLRADHGKTGRQRAVTQFSQEKMWDALREEYLVLNESGRKRTVTVSRQSLSLPETIKEVD